MNKSSVIAKIFFSCVLSMLAACTIHNSAATQTIPHANPQSPTTLYTQTPSVNSTDGEKTKTGGLAISQDRLFSFLDKLTAIKPYAGWRLSASDGEYEALQYVEAEIKSLPFLNSLHPEYEWQTFHVPISIQFWKTSLDVQVNGLTLPLPVNGIRGWRSSIQDRLLMDSDGELNDGNNNPISAKGTVISVQTRSELDALNSQTQSNNIIFINDDVLMVDAYSGNISAMVKTKLDTLKPSAIVIVTENSDKVGENHGTFANEIGPVSKTRIPVIQMRAEDAVGGKLAGWNLINQISSADIVWDTDLFAPGTSHNLVIRVPGKDSSHAMILSAHIDSVATPGAMDDGSGSAILLEIAHVLDDNKIHPETDLYLVWFGSEELGLYGSTNFVNTHQELLDKTIANLNVDCLSRPLDGVQANIQLAFWPGNWDQRNASPWVNALTDLSQKKGIESHKMILNVASDNSSFDAYNVPNLDMIYDSDDEMNGIGGIWYGGHIHDPYDNVSTARESATILVQMAQVALEGILLPSSSSNFRTSPASIHRAVFIGTHTEPPLMTPTGLLDFSMLMADSGFDIDLIPYGQTFSKSDLEKADMVFILPVADFPSSAGDVHLYDESWSASEIETLREYVSTGGFIVLTNSSQVTGFYGSQQGENEDWEKMNALSEIFGIKYTSPNMDESDASFAKSIALTNYVSSVEFVPGEVVGFHAENGQTLASTEGIDLVSLTTYGTGKVLALADLGMFSAGYSGLLNPQFISNLADFAVHN